MSMLMNCSAYSQVPTLNRCWTSFPELILLGLNPEPVCGLEEKSSVIETTCDANEEALQLPVKARPWRRYEGGGDFICRAEESELESE